MTYHVCTNVGYLFFFFLTVAATKPVCYHRITTRRTIMPSSKPKPGQSLAERFPEVADQWHPTKNDDLTPLDVTYGSGRRVWWRCEKGHEWGATPNRRTASSSGCPYCASKRATPQTSIVAAYPEIAAQWHPTKNGDLTPDQVLPRSRKKVWWLCMHGHEWVARVSYRTWHRSVCPYCAGRRVTPKCENHLRP